MAGKKYGVVVQARVTGAYHALPRSERETPGKVFEELMGSYAGKIDFVRRYWSGLQRRRHGHVHLRMRRPGRFPRLLRGVDLALGRERGPGSVWREREHHFRR